ncbi:g11190 [Coccomyxa viridis]|uniref:G11190 protein n=1 Tax=Coccomyxa viridis TaxID=1274662 RepID=A0ABP1GC20_9CHLO
MARKRKADQEAGPSQRRGRGSSDLQTDAEPAEQDEAAAIAEEDDVAVEIEDADDQVGNQRREEWAALARRRAAHFAHFGADDEEEDEDNLHTGGTEARALGPWSSARQLVEGRAAALSAREDKIAAAAQAAAEAEAAADWAPKRDHRLGPRPSPRVGRLFDMCLDLLVEYIEDVETLYGLPSAIKVQLASAVCKARFLTPTVLRLFTEDTPDEVVLPECSALEAPCLSEAMAQCASPRLERLELGTCGRGFGDVAAAAMADKGSLPGLRSLRLGGAYRLKDADLERLLACAPDLDQLRLPQCSLLQDAGCLPRLCPGIRILDLSACRGISASSLQSALPQLKQLEVLHLDGNPEVSDELLAEVALGCSRLQRISVSNCSSVTDKGVRGLAAGAPRLLAFVADDVGRLTDGCLLALGESCKSLQVASLRRCTKVTSVGLAALTLNGSLRSLNVSGISAVGPGLMKALADSCSDSLEELNVSWCRGVPEPWLGVLADACTSLRKLTVFGCSQVSEKFLNGHSNELLEVVGVSIQKSPAPQLAKAALLMAAED